MHWPTILICTYGVVKEFRPMTPFLTPYLVSSYKNLTIEEVYGDVYPYWTYSYTMFLIPVFFLTDVFRYKPIIILEAISLSITCGLLVWGQGLLQMQLMQVIFGLATASDIAYYSYIYAVVEGKKYKRMTSYTRTAVLIGKLCAYSIAQLLVSSDLGNYLLLNQISFSAAFLALLLSIALPAVPARKTKQEEVGLDLLENRSYPVGVVHRTLRNLAVYRTDFFVFKWSLWWALATCGIYQVYNYTQTLWAEMQPDPEHVYNGATELASTAMGVIFTFAIQYPSFNWIRHGEKVLCLSSLIICALLYVLSVSHSIILAYTNYAIISTIYHILITVASANVASSLSSSQNGLIFGCNTFAAVVLQTILTLLVADSRGFNLDIRTQFVIYSAFFGVLALVFAVFMFCSASEARSVSNDDHSVEGDCT